MPGTLQSTDVRQRRHDTTPHHAEPPPRATCVPSYVELHGATRGRSVSAAWRGARRYDDSTRGPPARRRVRDAAGIFNSWSPVARPRRPPDRRARRVHPPRRRFAHLILDSPHSFNVVIPTEETDSISPRYIRDNRGASRTPVPVAPTIMRFAARPAAAGPRPRLRAGRPHAGAGAGPARRGHHRRRAAPAVHRLAREVAAQGLAARLGPPEPRTGLLAERAAHLAARLYDRPRPGDSTPRPGWFTFAACGSP